ncbi:hypothetical protein U5N28_07800 [Lysinibacillus telephonicus]
MKNNIETSVTVICLMASIVGMTFISIATVNFLIEQYDNARQLLTKLF